MSAAPDLTTPERAAIDCGLPIGRVLYIIHQPNAPRPTLRRGRETLYDRDELLRHLRATHWVARC